MNNQKIEITTVFIIYQILSSKIYNYLVLTLSKCLLKQLHKILIFLL